MANSNPTFSTRCFVQIRDSCEIRDKRRDCPCILYASRPYPDPYPSPPLNPYPRPSLPPGPPPRGTVSPSPRTTRTLCPATVATCTTEVEVEAWEDKEEGMEGVQEAWEANTKTPVSRPSR